MSIRSIGEFLEQYRSEGHMESSGTFTLDWNHALSKLGKYQSESPGLYLIKLLQSAVASGASAFDVRQRGNETRVFYKVAMAHQELIKLLSIRHTSTEPGVEDLQLALQALSSIPKCTCELHYHTDERVYAYSLEEGLLHPDRFREYRPHYSYPNRIEIRKIGENPLWKVALGLASTLVEESMFLQEMGRFAPLSLRVDGRLLNDPVVNKPPGLRLGVWVGPLARRPRPAIPYSYMERIVLTEEPTKNRMGLADHSMREPEYMLLGEKLGHPNGGQAYLQEWINEARAREDLLLSDRFPRSLSRIQANYRTFDSKIERADNDFQLWPDYNRDLPAITVRGYISHGLAQNPEGRLYIVKNGVSLKPKPLGKGYAGCLAIWSDPRVRTDISQLQALEDEIYENALQEVKTHFRASAQNLLTLAERAGHRSFWKTLKSVADTEKWARNLVEET